jgi:hypothetical protein
MVEKRGLLRLRCPEKSLTRSGKPPPPAELMEVRRNVSLMGGGLTLMQ